MRIMKSLELKVNKRIYDKLLWLLGQFSSEDIIIVNEDSADKLYLQEQLKIMEEGRGNFISIEEMDDMLEERIKKYED